MIDKGDMVAYVGHDDLDDVVYPNYGDFRPCWEEDNVWFEPPYSGYSDYSGSLIERANVEYWQEVLEKHHRFDGKWKVAHGDMGTVAVFLHKDLLDDKLISDTLNRLEDYPALDEEKWSELTVEAEDEAWENWAEADMKSALRVFGVDDDFLEMVDEDRFKESFEYARERANEYWNEETGGGMTINLTRVASQWVKMYGVKPGAEDEDERV